MTQSSFNIINQSTVLQRYSINELHLMLKFAFNRLKSYCQSHGEDELVHPMDINRIETNLNSKKYCSTQAFLADIKWILHQSIISNGSK